MSFSVFFLLLLVHPCFAGWILTQGSCTDACAALSTTCDIAVQNGIASQVHMRDLRTEIGPQMMAIDPTFKVAMDAGSLPGTNDPQCPYFAPNGDGRWCRHTSPSTCNGARSDGSYRVCSCIGVEATIAGDPITYFGNRRVEFHLTVGQLELLLATPTINIYGSTIAGYTDDQWFTHILATRKDGKKLVDIRMKPDLDKFNRSHLPSNSFETLDVVMWDAPHLTPLVFFPPSDGYFMDADVTITFTKQGGRFLEDAPRRECVFVSSWYIKSICCSSSAQEYFGSGRGASKYAHLDLDFIDILHDKAEFTGVLPEVWGLAPRSASTEAGIISESFVGVKENSGDNMTGPSDDQASQAQIRTATIDVNSISDAADFNSVPKDNMVIL